MNPTPNRWAEAHPSEASWLRRFFARVSTFVRRLALTDHRPSITL
jgi:hypothetical protein